MEHSSSATGEARDSLGAYQGDQAHKNLGFLLFPRKMSLDLNPRKMSRSALGFAGENSPKNRTLRQGGDAREDEDHFLSFALRIRGNSGATYR